MAEDPYLGEIVLFAGNFAPVGYALCEGQILPISQNTALFSILGTTYGGDGIETFALPDLRGRVPLGQGQGPGLEPYDLGQVGGTEDVTLTTNQIPTHTHPVEASSAEEGTNRPSGAVPAQGGVYATAPDGSTPMNAGMIGATGGSQSHENRQPYLTLNFIIAMQGIFPSRN
jgi:microcystin-dependent protein